MKKADYQLIIVGGGPAGLTAGLYAARARLHAVMLEKGAVGGQALITDWIDNYPGFPEGISGFDLIERMTAQASRFGLEIATTTVTSMDLSGPVKRLFLEEGGEMSCETLIIATGARPRKLGVPGELELAGKGVSYCATCDGPFYRNLEIAVVGGGNTAIQEAIHLTKFASKVSVIHRRDQLRATKIIQDLAFANKKIHFILDTTVSSIFGQNGVEGLVLENRNGEKSQLPVQGVFVLVGTIPNNEMLPGHQLKLEDGFIVTDSGMHTNIPGVMAAGDICSKSVRQVVTAAGDGAIAALSAEHHLNS